MKKQLILEDGTTFTGEAFGAHSDISGEVVFNTGMTGYQEILSDPSYCDQMVVLTYPLIGNYGVNREDFESIHPALSALIVKEYADIPSHWRSTSSLDEMLAEREIPGLSGVDTRKLTRLIRKYGTMKGTIRPVEANVEEEAAELSSAHFRRDQVARVSTADAYHAPGQGPRIVLIDYGTKHGLIRQLIQRGADVYVVSYNTPPEDILKLQPDGVMLSNGPGDPADIPEALPTLTALLKAIPVFGICLGHQLICRALGAKTEKLPYGHRGSNHPVKDLQTGEVAITAQNHGYTVNEASLAATGLVVTHRAVNDQTVEGTAHESLPVFSVQYHPEAAPGPDDANPLFDRFFKMIETTKSHV
ncbi:carbamoyl-phosphate synthase small subunit [Salsuginibacillus halophilus]|uniref:Carbamoyl phosphate synthase small chain n=1 Tax=Salsuginibacillus halophilus TaxID=517424 RepID=A0A2P8HWZ8_9BACI|nr:carbamoyl phosphate synthase small subunit [Salsuginibacillus halophilus]PSL50749.1 carbamoyl-phosphate synthase small subunit [Salsuginibacillus halophilus]